MEKKTEAMTVHISDSRKKQVLKLADSAGMTGSEFICSLIESRLTSELSNYRVLQSVFEFEGTDGSCEEYHP
ncbi:hypothetical protein THIOSC15_3050002 [uncultured Thiomicrorhabdus sp.]